jgi:hypothetical protein
MKFCLSCNQDASFLAKADEIKVKSYEHKNILSLAQKYPNADIVLDWPCGSNEHALPQQTIIDYNNITKQKLIVCVDNITPELDKFCTENNIRYFWGYPISTTYELQGIKNFYHVCYIKVAAPLFFQMDILKKFDIPVRAIPNVADFGYIQQRDGINGTWIRPEDLESYEPVVTAVEFEDADKKKEQALFRIYAQDKAWPASLNYLITNLKADCANRMLPPEFTKTRLNCGQRCTAFGTCQLCYYYFVLANPDLIKTVSEHIDENSNKESN